MAHLRRSSLPLALTALLAILGIAAGTAVVLAPTTAEAVPTYGTHVKYYNNASCDVQVGYRYYTCEGVLESQWGVTSPYSTSATYGCTPEF